MFTMDVQFREGKQESFSTVLGVLISLLIISFVLIYGTRKADIWVNHGDSKHQTTVVSADRDSRPLTYNDTQFEFGAISFFRPKKFWSIPILELFDIELRDIDFGSKEQPLVSGFHKCSPEDLNRLFDSESHRDQTQKLRASMWAW